MTQTLNMLKIDETAKIKQINCSDTLKRRLSELGLIAGTLIRVLYKSPFKDPSAYLIRGAVIALRNDDTKYIEIEY